MSQIELFFEEANKAYQKQDFIKAQEYYIKILKVEPSFVQAHWQLSTIYWRSNNLKKVRNHYQKLLKLIPNSPALLNNLAALSIKQDKIDEAINYFNKALKIAPKHKESRNNLAAIFLQRNQFKEAIWNYSLYLNLEPDDTEALYNRGYALMLTGQLNKAIEDLKKILDLKVNSVDACVNLAAIYLKLNDKKTAAKYYKRVLTLQTRHPIATYMLSALNQQSIPSKPPLEYVKNLFDGYALQFDNHLKEHLDYKLPELVYEQIKPYLENKKYNILDLGCGTGLSGLPFSKKANKLTGIDISKKMLLQAKMKRCYTLLIEKDILNGLEELQITYDLILCIDTLVYFGDLDNVLKKTIASLKDDGLFVFSIELANENFTSYQLQATGRYQHPITYIEKLIKKYGLECLKQTIVNCRYQKNELVKSGLFILKKHS